jgi:branched-chain amino acid transport system permease protein
MTTRAAAAMVALLVGCALAAPLFGSDRFVLAIATQAVIWALLASSWDLLSGYTGQASFGHAGFFLIGAYTPAILSRDLGWSSWTCLPLGVAATTLAGLLVALPALRLRGHYLAIVTLAFAELVQLAANNLTDFTGGSFGIHDFGGFSGLPAAPLAYDRAAYAIVLLVVAVSIAAMWLICEASRIGDAFRATREDQLLAQALGIDTERCKLFAFALSAGFAGLAGGLFAYEIQLVTPSVGSATTSAMVIGMAVFGGLGTIWGPAAGALLLFIGNEGLRSIGLVYNLVTIGLIIMVFVIALPGGLASLRKLRQVRRRRADDRPVAPRSPMPARDPATAARKRDEHGFDRSVGAAERQDRL